MPLKEVKTKAALKKAMKEAGVRLPHGYEIKKRTKKKKTANKATTA